MLEIKKSSRRNRGRKSRREEEEEREKKRDEVENKLHNLEKKKREKTNIYEKKFVSASLQKQNKIKKFFFEMLISLKH